MVTGAIPSLQLDSILEPINSMRPRDVGRLNSQFRQTYRILLHQSRHYAHPHAFYTSRDTRGSRGNMGSFITVTIAEAQRRSWPTMDLSRRRVALHCTFHGLIMELLRTNVFLETENTEFKKWTNTVWTLAVERCAAVGAHSENDSQNGPLYPPCKDGRSSTALSH